MHRRDLASRVASLLRESDIRKPVKMSKQVFHISTDDGSQKDFVVRQSDKRVAFTIEDVDAVIGACLEVMKDAMKKGETTSIKGFGTLGLKYRKPRQVKRPFTDEIMPIDGRYVPKFSFGDDLRTCAKIYEASLKDGTIFNSLSLDDGEDGD